MSNYKDKNIKLSQVLENWIHEIVSQGNLTDIEIIKKQIDEYLFNLFGEKKFKEILDELAYNKMNKEK